MSRCLVFLLVGLLFAPWASAQEMEFMPGGAWSVRLSQSSLAYDRVNSRVRTSRALLVDELNNAQLEPGQVLGQISRSETRQVAELTLGWSDDFNLRLNVPQVTKERTSDLSYAMGDTEAAAFAEDQQTTSSSGTGDMELIAWWRHVHSDYNFMASGLFFQSDSGEANFDDPNALRLGQGMQQFGGRVAWDAYLSGTRLMFRSRVQMAYFLSSETQDASGETVTVHRTYSNWARSAMIHQLGPIYWGIELEYVESAPTFLDNLNLRDNQQGLFNRFLLGGGSLRALESDPSTFPWNLEVAVDRAYWGTNLPLGSRLNVALSLYF